jgi:hypothetical protein
MCGDPAAAELLVILMAALCARPVSGRQGGCFIEEEELGVRSRAHDRAATAAELQSTHQPSSTLTVPHDPLRRVVEHASITEHLASIRHSNKFTKGSDSVLSWHDGLLVISA